VTALAVNLPFAVLRFWPQRSCRDRPDLSRFNTPACSEGTVCAAPFRSRLRTPYRAFTAPAPGRAFSYARACPRPHAARISARARKR